MAIKGLGAVHSPQGRYIDIMGTISNLSVVNFPLIKEELNVKIEFEGDEILNTSYQLNEDFLGPSFKEFFFPPK